MKLLRQIANSIFLILVKFLQFLFLSLFKVIIFIFLYLIFNNFNLNS